MLGTTSSTIEWLTNPEERTVSLSRTQRARCVNGDGLWTEMRWTGRRWRGHGSMTTNDVLARLPEGSFERDRALGIVARLR